MSGPELADRVGVVVIGRNEGERLERCLRSLVHQQAPIVYVDSGSTDGSVVAARRIGAEVVELDTTVPFTMARGRNAGFRHLMERRPETRYVQFVDGDCEVDGGWIERARGFLDERGDVTAVAGRRRERHPKASVYNRLCDLEWDRPLGEVHSVGGDMMIRAGELQAVGGFREGMIAGEEPELFVRIRSQGGRVWRVAEEMTLHDADMHRFSQWWRRAVRAGHAYAEGAALHGRGPARHNVRQVRSASFWGFLLPASILAAAVVGVLAWPWARAPAAFLAAGYPVLSLRIYLSQRRAGRSRRDARLYAFFCVLAKWPQFLGILRYRRNRRRGQASTLIEYKAKSVHTVNGAGG